MIFHNFDKTHLLVNPLWLFNVLGEIFPCKTRFSLQLWPVCSQNMTVNYSKHDNKNKATQNCSQLQKPLLLVDFLQKGKLSRTSNGNFSSKIFGKIEKNISLSYN